MLMNKLRIRRTASPQQYELLKLISVDGRRRRGGGARGGRGRDDAAAADLVARHRRAEIVEQRVDQRAGEKQQCAARGCHPLPPRPLHAPCKWRSLAPRVQRRHNTVCITLHSMYYYFTIHVILHNIIFGVKGFRAQGFWVLGSGCWGHMALGRLGFWV